MRIMSIHIKGRVLLIARGVKTFISIQSASSDFYKVSIPSSHPQSVIRFPFHSPTQKITLNREALHTQPSLSWVGMHNSR